MKLKLPCSVSALAFLVFSLFFRSQAQAQSGLEKIKQFAVENRQRLSLSDEDISSLVVNHEYTDHSTGIQHIYATQKINGLTVVNSSFALHATAKASMETNQLISIKSLNVRPVTTSVSSLQAVQKLMTDVGYTESKNVQVKQPASGTDQVTVYSRTSSSMWDIPTRLVYYGTERSAALLPAWEVQMMDLYKKHYWLAYVDAASGKILEKRDLIMHCDFGGAETDANTQYHGNHQHSFVEAGNTQMPAKILAPDASKNYFAIIPNSYRVYDMPLESPGDTLEQAALHSLTNRSGDVIASPDGWHRTNAGAVPYQYTRGNNVWAFQDPSPGPLGGVPSADPSRTAYNNGGVAGTSSITEPFLFDYPVNLANDPTAYRNGAIVNLFYWNNLMHDVFYRLGFTESAGNFQESPTFSTGTRAGGSAANDAVLAQAQDGGGTNNANFLTTPDGTPGQMQMYLWTAALPDSLVQITSSSTGVPPGGTKYIAIQGSFNALPTDSANTNLFTRPVVNKLFVVVKKNPLSPVGTETEGCSTGQQSIALPPGNDVSDKIVLIDRGNCSFIEKVLGAQEGGAAGVIVINNTDGPPQAMGGADAPGNAVRIPAVMVSKADGTLLKNQILNGATIIGSLKRNAPAPPKRDGDLDNGVIAHEYGHGISSRMTAPNTLGSLGGSEQGGEGWSDFMALYMTLRTNDLKITSAHPKGELPTRSIGNYVTYQSAAGRGIRPTPYSIDMSVNPSTFKDIGKGGEITVPHGVGYIWCTMMYEMLQSFIDKYGMGDDVYEGAAPVNNNPPAVAKGNNVAMRLILEGIKLQGTSPTFERQRNAILKADTLLYNAQHACMIWQAFAKRGLGASAKSNTNGVGDEIEAYDVPLTCNANQKRVGIVKTGPGKLTNGAPAAYTITVTNKYPVAANGVVVSDTLPPSLIYVSSSDNGVFNQSTNVVSWTVNLAANASKILSLQTTVNTAASSTTSFSDDHEAGRTNWTSENTGGVTTWRYDSVANQAFSGKKYWFVPNPEVSDGLVGSNSNLRTTVPITIPANGELAFIHRYSTEQGYDGGVVEYSVDNITWTYIPPTQFVRGGYNGIITTTNNPAIGSANLAAFTGTSPGYIVSIARLNNLVGQNIYLRFRFTCDQTGGVVPGGGWWMDDVYILANRTELTNSAVAITTPGQPTYDLEGANARSSSSAFVLSPGGTLPSALGTLTASVSRQSTVNLVWSSSNETGGEIYNVERKANGENTFTKVGVVNNSASSTRTKQYNFVDDKASMGNKYQYRINQVRKNGEFFYTNVAIVSLGVKAFSASIYPNPANNVANINISNPLGGKVTINLYDALGKKLASFIGAEASSQIIPLPVQGLSAGTYWVEVNTTNDDHATMRLIINK